MKELLYAILGLSVILIILIMLQSKGAGLSITPGTGDFGKFERRGAEKNLHIFTITLVIIYIALCIAYYISF